MTINYKHLFGMTFVLLIAAITFSVAPTIINIYKTQGRIEGYQLAQQDYARAKALPVFTQLINETTNETQNIIIPVQVCSQVFIDNYQRFCGGGE